MKAVSMKKLLAATIITFFVAFTSAPDALAQGGTWTTKTPMPTARNGPVAASINGIVYAVGGGDVSCNPYSTVEAYDPATNTWTTKAPMPTPRYSLTVVAVNQILYAIGGGGFCSDGGNSAAVEAYNPVTNTWTTKASLPFTTRVVSASVINGIIYVVDGYSSSQTTVYAYDPATNAWTTKAAVTHPGAGAAAAMNGILYYAGGSISSVDAYDPATDTWTRKASSIPMTRNNLGAGVINGKIYFVGGEFTAEMDAYDPATDTWTTQTPMPTTRGTVGVAVANGVLYALGGHTINYGAALATNEAFIPGSGTWTTKTSEPEARVQSAGVGLGGLFYVFGGSNGNGASAAPEVYDPVADSWVLKAPDPISRSVVSAEAINNKIYVAEGWINADGNAVTNGLRIYDPATNTWATGASSLLIRGECASAAIGGKLYITGGVTSGNTVHNELQIYDPVSNSWSSGAAEPVPLGYSRGAAIDGKFYVVGGATPSVVTGALRIYDPVTNTWTSGAAMPTPRADLVVGVIDGKLYAVGGFITGGTVISTVEIYDPVSNTWATGPPAPTARASAAGAVLNSKLYVTGGQNAGNAHIGTLEVFAPILKPVITSPLTATGTVAQQFTYQFGASGATSLGVTNLPPGLAFNSNLSAIIGNPTASGTFQVGLSATNSAGTTNATLTITVQSAPTSGPVITSSASATGRVGQRFSFQITTTGGSPAARVSATGLPAGLSIDAVTGLISGTPTAEGSFPVTLTVTDGNLTTTSVLQLTFTANPAIPVIVSSSTASVTSGQSFTYTIKAPTTADPSDVTIYTLIGALPQGLTFDPNTGIISGTFTGNLQPGALSPDRIDLSGGIVTNVQLFATNSHGTSTVPLIFLLTPTGAVNIATRLAVGTGDNVLIGGFIITGNAPKRVIIRALGPSLNAFGIANALQDTTLELHDGTSLLGSNDDWRESQENEIIATALAPTDNRESAILATLAPGHYTAIVAGKNTSGIAVVEVYDLGTASLDNSGNSRLANIATRGPVLGGDNVMIGGFIVSGQASKVVVRAIGPSLSAFGISGTLQDPTLALKNANGATLIGNDDWQQGQPAELQQVGLAPSDPRESALVATLAPGQYTAIVSGKDNATGIALVEVYAIPSATSSSAGLNKLSPRPPAGGSVFR